MQPRSFGPGSRRQAFPVGRTPRPGAKIVALVLGAGMLLEVFSPPGFFPDFVLAIAAWLS